ncbi:GntR family transcriptional regulator [Chthonobacter albigriseus]|uniref:GntR family transcriptional regulator n=1 Tax=Chthonobacter albigriseus TaxID=1683161 RepID=UPI0015EF7862
MPVKAVEPRRLYRQVADQLRALIESGEFAPGARLPSERDLAEQLGLSRPTVREALIALEVEGLITIRVGAGIFVKVRPQPVPRIREAIEGPFELLRARAFIEGAVAAEAARLAGPDDVEALDDVLDRMEHSAHPSAETLSLDRAFHTTVAGILGNAVMVRFIGELFDQRINPYFARLSSYFENPETWRAALLEHRAVRDAIAAGDEVAARSAMRFHLERSQDRFSLNFSE